MSLLKRGTAWLIAIVASSVAFAEEIPVAPGGLADAISKAVEGDTLVLKPGVYRENVKVEKTLTLRGQPGAVLEGTAPFEAEWKEAGEELKGAFNTPIKGRPKGLLVDGKFIAEIRYDRAKEKGDWHWRTLLGKGTPLSGFEQVRALWMYHPEEKKLYVRFGDGESPVGRKLSMVSSAEPLVRISGAKGVVVEGLAFAGSSDAVVLDEGASECVIRKCKVTSFESTGIVLKDGATNCVVEECDITRGSLEEWTPSLEHSRPNYEIWRVHKQVGNYDRNGIVLYHAGAGNRILRNRLERVFDGIALGDYKAESLDKPAADPEHGRGTEIAGNVIENTRDSGIELGVGCVEVNVHHNVLRRTHGGLRFKVPREGPIYIHHNRLIDGAPFCIWISMDAAPAEAYFYHNTILRGTHDALYVPKEAKGRNFIAPKWHFLNNLVLENDGFCEPSSKPSLDITAAHNVVTGKLRPWPDDASKDKGSLYDVSVEHDENGKPAAGSAAIDAGMDLSKYRNGKPLPGCEVGYFKGKAPDAGADEVK